MLPELLDTCLEHLEDTPFIEEVHGPGPPIGTGPDDRAPKRIDGEFEVVLIDGTVRNAVFEISRTNLTRTLVAGISAQLLQRAHPGEEVELLPFLFARHVTPDIGRFLTEQEINYVDAVGNRFVRIDNRYAAVVEGRRPARRERGPRGLRAPAYQVIFVLLAQDPQVRVAMRELAATAYVAVGTVKNTIDHLRETGTVARARGVYAVHDRAQLIELWVHGYEAAVRPRWFEGRFATQVREPQELAELVQTTLAETDTPPWALGGTAAAHAMTAHYRGPETTLHIAGPTDGVRRALRAVPDPTGNLALLRTPPGVFMEGTVPHAAHPLLVYAELLAMHQERADEAAELVRIQALHA